MKPRTKKPLRGGKLARAVINQIVRHPETWDQAYYHCGTTHCFAGLAQILAGYRPNNWNTRAEAMKALNIDMRTANKLFYGNSLQTLIRFAANHERETPAKFDKKKGFVRL